MNALQRGFTLIEVLVVVLIIGILAAIAFPVYEKAVEQSRSTQAMTMLRAAYDAAAGYYMTEGTYPPNFDAMGLGIPWEGKENWSTQSGVKDVRSNADWSLQLYHAENGSLNIYIGRLRGKYKGAGFEVRVVDNKRKLMSNVIRCAERKSSGLVFGRNPGEYCEDVMSGSQIYDPLVSTYNVYEL